VVERVEDREVQPCEVLRADLVGLVLVAVVCWHGHMNPPGRRLAMISAVTMIAIHSASVLSTISTA
jgi:hypothetical protein